MLSSWVGLQFASLLGGPQNGLLSAYGLLFGGSNQAEWPTKLPDYIGLGVGSVDGQSHWLEPLPRCTSCDKPHPPLHLYLVPVVKSCRFPSNPHDVSLQCASWEVSLNAWSTACPQGLSFPLDEPKA